MEFVERLLAEAAARGRFDAGAASGRRVDVSDDGPGWWVRREVERARSQQARTEVIAEVETALGSVWALASEDAVRARVAELNRRLEKAGAADAALDPDETVRVWRRMAGLRYRRP